MSSENYIHTAIREKILAQPDIILKDEDLMRALTNANEKARGSNIVDIRGLAMERLERRLDRLEETHKTVIAAAYENLSGINQIQRAILRMMEALDFPTFLIDLEDDVCEILRLEYIGLLFETRKRDVERLRESLAESNIIKFVPAGFIDNYITLGRNVPIRDVVLRAVSTHIDEIYGNDLSIVGSEALLKLSFGTGRMPGMLVLAAKDPHQFSPNKGTDLLSFFAGVFERIMRQWLV